MATTDPTLTIELNDVSPDVKGFTYTEAEMTLSKVADGTTGLVTGDSFVSIGLNNITAITKIIIFSSNVQANGTLRINHDPGGGAVDKDIPFTGFLALGVPAAFASEINAGSGLSLSTDEAVQTKYYIKVFGT